MSTCMTISDGDTAVLEMAATLRITVAEALHPVLSGRRWQICRKKASGRFRFAQKRTASGFIHALALKPVLTV